MTLDRVSQQAAAGDLTRVVDAYIDDDADGKWICRKFASGVIERLLTVPSKEWHDARAAEVATSAAAEAAQEGIIK